MSLPLPLPTPSSLTYPHYLTSPTHPSLPLSATTSRHLLRSSLKTHSRLPPSQKAGNLPQVLGALGEYVPYLFAINSGLGGKGVSGEEVDVVLRREVEGGWTSVLGSKEGFLGGGGSGGFGGRKLRGKARCKGKGLDYEVCFVLTTLAVVWRGLARERLRGLVAGSGYASTSISTGGTMMPMAEERAKGVAAAMKYLLQVEGVCGFLAGGVCEGLSSTTGGGDDATISGEKEKEPRPPETSPQVQGGMRELAMAEATLLAVLKDDPYPAVVVQERNKNDKEWMIKAPEIPKVRAHLFARLCIAAGEHAGRAEAMLGSFGGKGEMRVDEDIIRYASDLRRTARAKACRFFGIDDELGGKTGKAIAWLRGARKELGLKVGEEGEKGWAKGWGKLKKGFNEKREDKRLEKGGEWGADAGRMEEGRVVEMLEKKWVKTNDTINTQLVPPFEPLLAGMPSGREIHSSTTYVPPELDADVLEKMRAPPDPEEAKALMADGVDSSDDEGPVESGLPGAYPGKPPYDSTATEYY